MNYDLEVSNIRSIAEWPSTQKFQLVNFANNTLIYSQTLLSKKWHRYFHVNQKSGKHWWLIVHDAGHSDKAALVPYSRGCPLKIVWDTDMKHLKIRTEEHQKIKKEEKKATLVHVNRLSVDHRTIVSTGRYSEWTCKVSQCFLEHYPSIFSFAKFFSLGIKCYTRWFCTGF